MAKGVLTVPNGLGTSEADSGAAPFAGAQRWPPCQSWTNVAMPWRWDALARAAKPGMIESSTASTVWFDVERWTTVASRILRPTPDLARAS